MSAHQRSSHQRTRSPQRIRSPAAVAEKEVNEAIVREEIKKYWNNDDSNSDTAMNQSGHSDMDTSVSSRRRYSTGSEEPFRCSPSLLTAEGIALIVHPKMQFDPNVNGSVVGKIVMFGKKALVKDDRDVKPIGIIRYRCQNRLEGDFSCKLEMGDMFVKFSRDKRPARFSSSWKKEMNVVVGNDGSTNAKLRKYGYFVPGPKAAKGTTFHLYNKRKQPTEYCRVDEARKVLGLLKLGDPPHEVTKTFGGVHPPLPGIHVDRTDGAVSVDFGKDTNEQDRLALLFMAMLIKCDNLSEMAPEAWRKQQGGHRLQQWFLYVDQGFNYFAE